MHVLRNEPALVVGVIVALLNLGVGLGYLTESAAGELATVAESGVILLAALLVRSKVSPTGE